MIQPDQRRRFMQMALALGRRGQGLTWPNPSVGCVIVKDGRVVGRGWTRPGGRPHAEVVALTQAGDAARGADVFVTLEPCAHHGQTAPCADALITAGVARVFVATSDPDPRTNGKGLSALRAAGIDVTVGELQAEADADHAGFFSRVRQGRPFLTLKLATTVDGRIATASGESQWITGPEARRKVHMMRARHDAVLIGAGTARADDPTLTVRGLGTESQPVRIVASRQLDLPWPNTLVATIDQGPVWVLHGSTAASEDVAKWQGAGAKLLRVAEEDGQLSAAGCLAALGEAGLTRVFCEGGGAFAAALLKADLVDALVTFTAGAVIGAEGRPGVGPLGLDALADAPRFDLTSVESIGDDVLHHWIRRR